jgi:uncharacterized protein
MRRRILTILPTLMVLTLGGAHGAGEPAEPDVRRRPQEPLRPLPYAEQPVSFISAAGVRLSGTLTLPAGGGRHPAVVLIGGTGPQDRDASVAGHRPFLVLADHLTRSGLAVLRFDERGVGRSTGDFASATTLDFATDVLAGVRVLKSHPRIDGRRVGLIGHSEGGMVAPLAANRSDDVAFVVLLAAPGLPVREIAALQVNAIARAEGVTEADVAARVRLSASVLELFERHGHDPAALHARARPVLEQAFTELRLPEHVRARQVELALEHYTSPWAQFALRYDPRPALRQLRVPVLALNGGRDVQVDAARNLAAIAEALATGSSRDWTTQELPGLNHLFQTAVTGGLGEYARIDETMAPAALRAVSDWVAAR